MRAASDDLAVASPQRPPRPRRVPFPRRRRGQGDGVLGHGHRPAALRTDDAAKTRRLFIGAGLATAVVLTVVGVLFVQQAATREAIRVAEESTYVLGHSIVEPELTPEVLAGDPAAIQRLHGVIVPHVLEESALRVKVWTTEGRIVYSDEQRLIGQTFPLDNGKADSLRTEGVIAEVSPVSEEENAYEKGLGRLLEVYVPIRATDDTQLLLEVYYPYELVNERARDVRWTIGPILAGALAALGLVQLLVAGIVIRRLRRAQAQREQVLMHALEASDADRRRIASNLHDGVVQQLVASSISLQVEANKLATSQPAPRSAGVMRAVASDLHASIRALRSLFVDIYPPNLQAEGLVAALTDLLAPLEDRGIAVSRDLPETLQKLPLTTQAIIYRVAQEALRNVSKHAHARHVMVSARRGEDDVQLVVADDGRGVDADDAMAQARAGHVGFRLMTDLARDADGTLHIDSAAGEGTRVRLTLPAPSR